MDVYEVTRTRRSVRKYAATPIPEEVLGRVLDAARIAPSGSNRQPTRLIVVTEGGLKRELVPYCHNQGFVGDAPVVVIACGRDISYNRGEWMERYSMLVDVSIAVDHLTLAARAEGLGTCWIGSFNGPALKEYLRLPEDWYVVALTPIGYPEGDAFTEPEGRIPMEEFVMWNGWRE